MSWCYRVLTVFTMGILSGLVLSCMVPSVYALEAKPAIKNAEWGGTWGTVKVLPSIVKHGEKVHVHGIMVGGTPGDPWWSCSQYSAWVANGTSGISVKVPGTWSMAATGSDIFGNLVNTQERDGGNPPPYGWEDRISDTCYCYVDGWGAHGGCESREVQPELFYSMDQNNPREGNVQFATVNSGSGWVQVKAHFSGRAGVAYADYATNFVYVVSDDSQLQEDSDHDGLPDAWEYSHSLNQSLDDFGGGPVNNKKAPALTEKDTTKTWINPYAPSESGWEAVDVNDWDGDGLSNRQEYEFWLQGLTDKQNFPFDPTFINFTGSFPFYLILPAIQNRGAEN